MVIAFSISDEQIAYTISSHFFLINKKSTLQVRVNFPY